MKTILVTTYSPCIHGSYGIVSREIFKRVYDSKRYRIVHHGWFHTDLSNEVPWTVIPTNTRRNPHNGQQELDVDDIHGQKSFKDVIAKVKPDIVWALGDFYMLQHVFAEKKNYPSVQFICHLAVDGEPWHTGTVAPVKEADEVVAISEYGSQQLSALLQRPVPYIHHGVDTDAIYPFTPERRSKQRSVTSKGMFNDDSFVIGWVGKDQFRKQVWKYWELLHYLVHGDYVICSDCGRVTLKEYDKTTGQSREPGRLRMYDATYDYSYCWHCRSANIQSGKPRANVYGYFHMPYKPNDPWHPNQLQQMWKLEGRIYNTQNLGPNRGIDDDKMVGIYNLFDLFYCMSGGEGFGMPVLESMAAKVPVMYTNYSAHAEVVGDCGIPVNVNWIAEMNSCYDRSLADTADAVAKCNKIIDDRSLLQPLIDRGYERALSKTWESIGQEWLAFIDKIASRNTNALGVVI